MPKLLLPLFILGLILASCASGKKAYEQGDYDKAVMQAVKRLRQKPDHKKASAALRKAYPASMKWHLAQIDIIRPSDDDYRWDKIVDHYTALQNLYEEISRCPSCERALRGPAINYASQLQEAKGVAAEFRYNMGVEALSWRNNKEKAREAYYHFDKALEYVNGFRDAEKLREQAKLLGTVKVVMQPIALNVGMYDLSNEFFQNKIQDFLYNYRVSDWVEFYSPLEAEARGIDTPDQVILIRFDEFTVGQTYVKETIRQLTRDSVVVGQIEVMGKDSQKVKQDVLGTVKAEMHTFEKTMESRGILDFRIIEPATGRILTQEKFPGQYIWQNQWGYYKGDERALSRDDLEISERKELPPPSPQHMFISFTQPIMSQVIGKIQNFYRYL